MGISEIIALITVAMPLIVQAWRFVDARIENERYHALRDGMKDFASAVEEVAAENPELYATGLAKFNAAMGMARNRWPKVPVALLEPMAKAVLKELGLGAAAKKEQR